MWDPGLTMLSPGLVRVFVRLSISASTGFSGEHASSVKINHWHYRIVQLGCFRFNILPVHQCSVVYVISVLVL